MSATAEAMAALHELVKSTLGALMIGMFFSSTYVCNLSCQQSADLCPRFFGITLLQTYQYYDKYWSDAWWLKLFVCAFLTFPTSANICLPEGCHHNVNCLTFHGLPPG